MSFSGLPNGTGDDVKLVFGAHGDLGSFSRFYADFVTSEHLAPLAAVGNDGCDYYYGFGYNQSYDIATYFAAPNEFNSRNQDGTACCRCH